jgi:hypothetical protein
MTDADFEDVPDDTILWRYMNFASFYSLLLNHALFFRLLDRYTDAYEGTLPERTIKDLHEYRKSFDYTTEKEAADWIKKELATIESYKAHTLSNSWSINEGENYALWKIYLSGTMEGVAIKTTTGRLKASFDPNEQRIIRTGKVRYESLDYRQINAHKVSTNKRPFYAYEQEYRALIFLQFNLKDTGVRERVPKFEVGTTVNVDLDILVEEVYISPFAGEWFRPIVESAIGLHLPKLSKDRLKSSFIKDK